MYQLPRFILPFIFLSATDAVSFSRLNFTKPHFPIPSTILRPVPTSLHGCAECIVDGCVQVWEWQLDYVEQYVGPNSPMRARRVSASEQAPDSSGAITPAAQLPAPSAISTAAGADAQYSEIYTAYSLVTVVDPDTHSTSTSVQVNTPAPTWFAAPRTNAAGTRVEIATYHEGSNVKTVELAYPTPLYRLEDSYRLYGSQVKLSESGQASCEAFDFRTSINPDAPLRYSQVKFDVDKEDPLGWGYRLAPAMKCGSGMEFYKFMRVPPHVDEIPESLLLKCACINQGSHTGGRFSKTWRKVKGG